MWSVYTVFDLIKICDISPQLRVPLQWTPYYHYLRSLLSGPAGRELRLVQFCISEVIVSISSYNNLLPAAHQRKRARKLHRYYQCIEFAIRTCAELKEVWRHNLDRVKDWSIVHYLMCIFVVSCWYNRGGKPFRLLIDGISLGWHVELNRKVLGVHYLLFSFRCDCLLSIGEHHSRRETEDALGKANITVLKIASNSSPIMGIALTVTASEVVKRERFCIIWVVCRVIWKEVNLQWRWCTGG